MSSFSQKLRLLMDAKRLTVADLAAKIPCSKAIIYAWLKGTKTPERKIWALADALGVSKEDLMSADNDSVSGVESINSFFEGESPVPDDIVVIPEFRLCFAAGDGQCDEPTWEEVHDSDPCWYKRSFFVKHHIKPDRCKRSSVVGDSMEPTLYDGDKILWVEELDPSCVNIKDGAVYVLGVWGSLRVKRLSRLIDGTLVIRSDNPAYPEEKFQLRSTP